MLEQRTQVWHRRWYSVDMGVTLPLQYRDPPCYRATQQHDCAVEPPEIDYVDRAEIFERVLVDKSPVQAFRDWEGKWAQWDQKVLLAWHARLLGHQNLAFQPQSRPPGPEKVGFLHQACERCNSHYTRRRSCRVSHVRQTCAVEQIVADGFPVHEPAAH